MARAKNVTLPPEISDSDYEKYRTYARACNEDYKTSAKTTVHRDVLTPEFKAAYNKVCLARQRVLAAQRKAEALLKATEPVEAPPTRLRSGWIGGQVVRRA